jgi:hypothetical protein
MTRAVKYAGGSANNAGSVDYEYCLSCDGALSKRLEYGPGSGSARGTLLAGLRYEYDGLNVLRVDELYDNDSNGLETNDAWRARKARFPTQARQVHRLATPKKSDAMASFATV